MESSALTILLKRLVRQGEKNPRIHDWFSVHRPQLREVAIRFGQPWEMHSPGYATVVHDEEKGLYRIYWQ